MRSFTSVEAVNVGAAGRGIRYWLLRYSDAAALMALIIVAIVTSPYFLDLRNIMNVLRGASPMAIVAIAMTVVILSKGIDLSVGSILGASAMLVAVILPYSSVFAVPAGLLGGAALGLINGILITKFRVQPFIATLAMLIFARGIVYIVTDGANIVVHQPPEWFSFIGSGYVGPVPAPVLIALTIWVLVAYILVRTRFGRHVYAIGANEDAARLYGIKADRVKMSVYSASGFLAAVAGVVLVSRLTVAEPNAGQLIELDAISATLIGGTTFNGGVGGVLGTLLGILILAILANILNLLSVSPFVQMLLQGIIIVLAVIVSDQRSRTIT